MSANELSPQTIGEQDAYLEKSRIYIWSRKLAEVLGLSVSFDSNRGIVTIGGQEFTPAKVEQGRSFVKVRDVMDPLGLQVEWKDDSQTLALYQNKKMLENVEVFRKTPEKLGDAFQKNGRGYVSAAALGDALKLAVRILPGGLATVGSISLSIGITLDGKAYLEGNDVAQGLGMQVKLEPGRTSFTKWVTREEAIFTPVANIPVDGINAYLQDNRVHVWSRRLAELIGAFVSFDSQSRLLTFTLLPRQRIVAPTKVEDGKAFVTVRDIAEGFGFKVEFDSVAKAVLISKPTGQTQPITREEVVWAFPGGELSDILLLNGIVYMEEKALANLFNLTDLGSRSLEQTLVIFNETFQNLEDWLKAAGFNFQKDEQTGAITVFQEKEVERRTLIATVKPKLIREINGFFNLSRPAVGIVTSNYGMRIHPITHTYKMHPGIDFAGNSGDPIDALADGKVVFANYNGAYGNTVILDHHNGYFSRYSHIKPNGFLVSTGSNVTGGQLIAQIGTTGSSTGPHLHFGLYRTNWQFEANAVNPWDFVGDVLR